jgi:hypothetical protein
MYQSLSLRKERERCQKTMKEREKKYLVSYILAMKKIILDVNEFIF